MKYTSTAGAASQCYLDELILLKCELMLSKCQINTNTKKTGFLQPIKCLERVLKYSCLISTILNYQFPKTMFADFFVLILDLNSISSHFNSISSHFTSIYSSQWHWWEAAPTVLSSLVIDEYHYTAWLDRYTHNEFKSFKEAIKKNNLLSWQILLSMVQVALSSF